MSGNSMSIDWWLDQLQKTGSEVASTSLGASTYDIVGRTVGIPKELAGSCIAMIGDEYATQIGICSDQAGAQRLAGMMLGLGPDEELDEDGVSDAVCELINVVAGLLKTNVAAQAPKAKPDHMQLGLPVFIRGHLAVSAGVEAGALQVNIDEVPVHFLVLKPKST